MTSRADLARLTSVRGPQSTLARATLAFLITLLGLAMFASAFALAYGALHAERILPGVQVGAVALGGLDRRAAETELRRSLPRLGSGQLTVRFGDSEQLISYSELGRDYDMKRMLDQALSVGRAGSPFDQLANQLRTLFNGVNVPLAVRWDADLLARRISAQAHSIEADPVDATLTRPDGHYAVSPASAGRAVDENGALALAMTALGKTSAADTSVSVALEATAPRVKTNQAQAAADRAERVVAGPFEVTAGTSTLAIPASTINTWVHLEAGAPGEWSLRIESAAVAQLVDQFKAQADIAPTNAGYEFQGKEVVVTPSATGSGIDPDATTQAILGGLMERSGGDDVTSVSVAMTTVQPEFTTAQARSLVGRVTRLSRWTTLYDSSSRNGFGQNIRRPTNLIDGTVLQPGDVFDFVAVAGPITEENGYTGGAAIIRGNTVLDGVLGGGLCTCSTTLFNAALRAGFQIDVRRNHSYFIDRYPVGLDATIWINGSYVQTMSFTNDSAYPVLIRGRNGNGSDTFELWGVPDGRRVTLSQPRVWDEKEAWTRIEYTDDLPPGKTLRVEYAFNGFDSEVIRTVTAADGTVLHSDTFTSAYRRVIGHILRGRGPDDPKAGTIIEPDPLPS